MTPTWGEVNAAVLAVLGETLRSPERARSVTPSASTSKPVPSQPDIFAERLFALQDAEAIGDVAEVRVASGTVVTPLALDHLRRKRVAIRYVSSEEALRALAARRGEWGFAIESKAGVADAVRRILLEGWAEAGADVVEAAHWVAASEGRGAFILTDEASVATWLASRVDGIRPATVADPDAVARAIRHLGANIIVVEPPGKSIYLLKQMSERFRQGGAPVVPDHFDRPREAAR